MKNLQYFPSKPIRLLSLVVFLAGCSPQNPTSVVGKYRLRMDTQPGHESDAGLNMPMGPTQIYMEFKADGTFVETTQGPLQKSTPPTVGKWSLDGGRLTTTFDQPLSNGVTEWHYKVSQDLRVLISDDPKRGSQEKSHIVISAVRI